jgi:arginase
VAGLAEAIGARDAGNADSVLDDDTRDAATGLIGFNGLVHATAVLRTALRPLLAGAARPFVVGGDCTILLGVLAALHDEYDRQGERIGLWFLDGHADFYDGRSSPTGEGADMELAIATGHGPAGLVDLAGPPLVAAENVVFLGHRRPDDDPDVAEELGFLPENLWHVDATTITGTGPAQVGRQAEQRLAGQVGKAWLHLDLDVLDEAALPAVTYPQPGGLDWPGLAAVLAPLLASPALAGVSIADYNPDRDPDQRHARRIVQFLRHLVPASQ